ncbi:MAG: hypothetical protein KGI26_02860 [Thaumarchaeota archaeon]|nr:hypothetical protein [Nitrososphaerota archaeon]
MKRLVTAALLFLLVLAFLPSLGMADAQGAPQFHVRSLYTLNRYGYATVNETVNIANNGTVAIQVPSVTIGFGNLSSDVVAASVTPGFSVGSPPSTGGPFTVTGSQSIQAGANVTFVLSALLNNVVSTAKNGSLEVLTLSSPSISVPVARIVNVVRMPTSTSFKSSPQGLTATLTGSNNTYSATATNVTPSAVTSVRAILQSTVQDFNPLRVFSAQRTISAAANGTPVVTDEIQFKNLGTTPLLQIYFSLLNLPTSKITIITATATEPVLLSPFTATLVGGALQLGPPLVIGYPSDGIQPGSVFTLTYQYPLSSKYFTVSGGQVSVNIPDSPPVSAFVGSYNITLTLRQGAKAVQGAPTRLSSVTPWQTGTTSFAYSLSPGLFIEGGIPVASVVFVLLLIGLFVARTTSVESEGGEGEESAESSSEQASSMINAFDEKTDLINGLWQEIEGKDPNEFDKAYFDEVRGRLDVFRSKALARLNEVKQKSTSQKFFEVVNQIQVTEREVDRAAKDKLNLYQQYYLKQMRKEVFDRLLPQYTRRLEKALNQLSDELHTVQREAKLL